MQSCLSGPQSLSNVAEFQRALFQSLGEERLRDGVETDSGFLELPKKSHGKGGWNLRRTDAVATENSSQNSGKRRLGEAEAFFFLLKIEAGVDPGGAARTVDFQGAEQDMGFSARSLEPGKVVRDEEAGRVGEVRYAVGIAEEETGGPGHVQEDLSRAPARKPARRKPSRTRGSRRSKPKR